MKNKALEFIKINLWSLLGMFIGLIVIIVGISSSSGVDTVGKIHMAFGGDFYTEMYQVTRETGEAIQYRLYDIFDLIKLFFIFGGMIDICAFGSKLKMPKKVITSNDTVEATKDASVENAVDEVSDNTANSTSSTSNFQIQIH